ncbi:MAG: hypothetical protein IRY85_02465 [Micromonosporaceae bacterium]|nr:hypothetical protein [Micromonosporaceae bacterium]
MRTTNRILSILLGLVLLVVGLAVAIETALIAWGGRPAVAPTDRWYASLRELRFADAPFLTTAAITALVGLTLVILQLRPWPPERVQTSAGDGPPLSIARRSVEHRVEAAATQAGVEHPAAAVRGRPGRWRVRLRGAAWPDQRDAVMAAIRVELERLYAPPDTPVSITLRRPARRVA